MDVIFKNWIVQKVEKDLKNAEQRRKFLLALKFESAKVQEFISGAMHNWGMFCAVESEKPISQDFQTDPPEVVQALQEHFAKELATITQ